MKKVFFIMAVTTLLFDKAAAQQNRIWFLESAVRFTGDAEMVFLGPSLSAGAGVALGKHFSVSTSYTFFYAQLKHPFASFRTHTIDFVPNFHFRNPFNPAKGFYFGAGITRQFRKQTPLELMIKNSAYWAAAFNVGYRFPLMLNHKQKSLSIDLKTIGPYSEKSNGGNYTEIFTQVMIGIRFRY